MKRTLTASLVVLSLGLGHMGAAQSQKPTPMPYPYSITISSDPHTVKSGSKISLDVALKNILDRRVREPREVQSLGFKVVVSRAEGDPPAQTDRGREWNEGGWVGSGPYIPMEPGATVHRQIVVSDLYDMARPGKYLITLLLTYLTQNITSNTITVTVVH